MILQKLPKLKMFITAVILAIVANTFAVSPESIADKPTIYVPYSGLRAVIQKSHRSVLMDRKAFAKLLAQAKANIDAQPGVDLAQIIQADYTAHADAEKVELAGVLKIKSMSDQAVAVPVAFGHVGLTTLTLDRKDAPLGYDRSGRLVVIVTGRGEHTMKFVATSSLKELSSGGQQFAVTLPQATAGAMKFSAMGDLEIHASVPVSKKQYLRKSDRTTATLTLGGQSTLAVVLLGNGRQDEEKAIMLVSTRESAQIDENYQTFSSLATVHVLRRGVRELKFTLPHQWTVLDVACPDMVKWSVDANGKVAKLLTVSLRNSRRGTHTIHIKAGADRSSSKWYAPRVSLVNAGFSRGYLRVMTGENIRVRRETLKNARREDSPLGGKLYLHWDNHWLVGLDLATVKLRRACKARQHLIVSPQQLTLDGNFEFTAIGRQLFSLAFELPSEQSGFNLKNLQAVTVNGSTKGFEYRLTRRNGRRMLKIELAKPIAPEALTNVRIVMQRTPDNWNWQAKARPRDLTIPRIIPRADTVDGLISLRSGDDLAMKILKVPAGLKPVPVGKMASLGFGKDIQQAYSYSASATDKGQIKLRISRQKTRLRCDTVGLVSAEPSKLKGHWRLNYNISRASARKLRFLAAKSLGQEIKIVVPGRRLAGDGEIIKADKKYPAEYNLWQITLDSPVKGNVSVYVSYEISAQAGALAVPLVRSVLPECNELLAVQASDQIAVKIKTAGMREIDTIELPALPAKAGRLLAAYRLLSQPGKTGQAVSLALETTVHKHYEIPVAIAQFAAFKTYIGNDGSQQSEANFRIVNAGLQFLRFNLPKNADLWSVRVGSRQAKPIGGLDGKYQIELPIAKRPLPVRIIYAMPAVSDKTLEKVKVAGIELPDVTVNDFKWQVSSPPGYEIVSQQTRMQTDEFVPPTLAAKTTASVIGKFMISGSIFLPSLCQSRELAKSAMSMSDLRGVGIAIQLYQSANDDQWPESLHKLVEEGYASEKMLKDTEGRPFQYFPPSAKSVSGDTIIVRSAPVGGKYIMVLTANGSVSKVPVEHADMLTCSDGFDLDIDIEDESEVGGLCDSIASQRAGKKRVTKGVGKKTRIEGRYTLPVELIAPVGAGKPVIFTSLGQGDLTISLARNSRLRTWRWLAAALAVLGGIVLLKSSTTRRLIYVFAILAMATLFAAWLPATTRIMNSFFYGAISLLPLYLIIGIVRAIARKKCMPRNGNLQPLTKPASLLVLLCLSTFACGAVCTAKTEPLVVPYAGNATKAQASDKILVPYAQYIQLWNQAHPDEKIDVGNVPIAVSLAGAKYAAALQGDRLHLTLAVEVKAFGKETVLLPLPVKGLAVTGATLDGKAARLQSGSGGMSVLLSPGESGLLEIKAVTTPKTQGRRGSVEFSLPPVPAAKMTFTLPQDMELQAPGIEGTLAEKPVKKSRVWTVPLGRLRSVKLIWSPKVGSGDADKTLSATTAHEVRAMHWAILGSSRIVYKSSAGQRDKFGLLLPADATLLELKGANVRDFRVVEKRKIAGKVFKVISVRLQRPVEGSFALSLQWQSRLPALNRASPLLLPRPADVARENGSVSLFAARGMEMKVDKVTGARRMNIRKVNNNDTAVARYYWPYRPFAMSVKLSRFVASAEVNMDQLVRIASDSTQLFVDATVQARKGKLFGASFALPKGYELLSVVGEAVDDWHEQTLQAGNRLHVNFRRGIARTRLAIVLIREKSTPEKMIVPIATFIDPDGKPLADQKGRLAVQLVKSLSARTLDVKNLKSLPPRVIRGWLDSAQVNDVQFAYARLEPSSSLALQITPKPTRIRAEILAAITVKHSQVMFTYRLRYHISGSPIDRVKFSLPEKFASLVAIDSPAMRSVSKASAGNGRTQWTVALANEVVGTLDVTANFSLPLEQATKHLMIPQMRTYAPQGYQTVIAMRNLSRHEISTGETKMLSPLPLPEQRSLLSPQIRKSLLLVYRSFNPDWSMRMNFKPAPPATRVQAVIDLMAITTVIDRNGQCRYRVKLTLQNRSEQFLRLALPDGLKLWSAQVAGQKVKPAKAAGQKDEVLIPLVKTSPGGLPYDVELTLSGKVVSPLDGITKLSPPAVKVLGIGVMRTTWSLRLPGGYEYAGMSGNLSPVAGRAEIMSIGIDAKLAQLKRLKKAYNSMDYDIPSRKNLAISNVQKLNMELADDISKTQSYIQNNRNKLSRKEFDRLNLLVGGQKLSAQAEREMGVPVRSNLPRVDRQTTDLNIYVNKFAGNNAGLADMQVNRNFSAMPGFVKKAGMRQQAALAEDLKRQTQLEQAEIQRNRRIMFGSQSGQRPRPSVGIKVRATSVSKNQPELLVPVVSPKPSKAQADRVVQQLAGEQQKRMSQRRQRTQQQLKQLADNRMNRMYTSRGFPKMDSGSAGYAKGRRSRKSKRYRRAGKGKLKAMQMNAPAMTAPKKMGPRQPMPASGGSARDGRGLLGQVSLREPAKRQAAMPASVASGTFSLPIQLPEGEVQLDFARPGGDAELSIYAVPDNLSKGLWITVFVALAAIVFWLVGRFVKKLPVVSEGITTRKLILLIVLGAILSALVGLIALVVLVLCFFMDEYVKLRKQKNTV